MWFVLELVICPQEVTLARWTQPSGPLCLWQCFLMFAFQFAVVPSTLWYSTAMCWYSLGPHDFCDLELGIEITISVTIALHSISLSPHELPYDISLFVCGDVVTNSKNLFHLLIVPGVNKKPKKIKTVWHGFRGILKLSGRVNQASLKLSAGFSNTVCWIS